MMRVLRLISWLWYLTIQIVIGSWNVAVAAWRLKPMAGPAIVEYPMRATTDFEIAMFASAITITPGTLVLGHHHGPVQRRRRGHRSGLPAESAPERGSRGATLSLQCSITASTSLALSPLLSF